MSLLRHAPAILRLVTLILAGQPLAYAVDTNSLQVNPYRPSVGSPATLSTPQHVELEYGLAVTRTSDTNNRYTPFLAKYALNNRFGMTLGLTPIVQSTTDTDRINGFGDGSVTFKFAQPISDGFTIGEELTSTLPMANHHLGTIKPNQIFNMIASNDFDNFHSDININLTHIGDPQDTGVVQHQLGWSAGLSHPLTVQIGGGFELSGTQQQGNASSQQALESIVYNASNLTVFDLYLSEQRTGHQHTTGFGFGVTHLFAQ